MSVRDALIRGRARLSGPDGGREARLLLAHAAGVPGDALHRLDDADVTESLLTKFDALLDRRAAGEPVSRIIGLRAFWTHEFRVTPDVLDPRPETEVLVARALDAPFSRVLDLGTGSGCILGSLLGERPAATGIGTDLSEAALSVARDNLEALGVADRACLLRSDWFAGVAGRFDLIVSNPPYISATEMPDLAPEVACHDPHMALTPGGDGLDPYRAIAAAAPAHLEPGGRLLVEIGWRQGPQVTALFKAAGLADVAIHHDLEGRDRVVSGFVSD